ncbi:hypothetical protein ACFLIM_23645 [Nonomuraea sp. M3C6]|uniref:Cytochrome P450 n=1 Tax=Nonomuraea marmarensis TaxID=3351344 RepID=A0ABW7AIT2_9ACTN
MLEKMLPGHEGLLADPYPAYARLREVRAPHRVSLANGLYGWLVTRYDDARAALADPRLSKDPRNAPADWQEAGRGRATPGPRRCGAWAPTWASWSRPSGGRQVTM